MTFYLLILINKMFIISQFLLHKSNLCNSENISTYSIAIGLLIYTSIYLYLLYYNNDLLYIFNKFIIFIIGIDLLLSTFYHFNNNQTQLYNNQDTKIQDIYLDESNNKIQEHLIVSDDDLTEDFDENLDEEVEFDNESENFNLEETIEETQNDELEQDQLDQEQHEQLEEIPISNLQETIVEIPTQEIQHNNDIEQLLQSIPINDNVTNEIIIEQPKSKPKRQSKKRSSKVDQVL